jgi:hypothetical protein
MASQMGWSHEFCLSCDRQIAEGGTYCSQACRLADLEKTEKAGTAEAQTPSNLSSSASSTSSSSHGFYLPPAVNFTALKTPSPSRGFDIGPSTSHYYTATNGAYYATAQSASSASNRSQQRSLTPSSSRSSLASAASQNPSGISAQAAQQLNSYVRSFDQARNVRRMSRRYTQY